MIKVYRFAQSWIHFEKTVTLICDFFHALHLYTLCAANAIVTLCFAFWGNLNKLLFPHIFATHVFCTS